MFKRQKIFSIVLSMLLTLPACRLNMQNPEPDVPDQNQQVDCGDSNTSSLSTYSSINALRAYNQVNIYSKSKQQTINLKVTQPLNNQQIQQIARQYNARVLHYLPEINLLSLRLLNTKVNNQVIQSLSRNRMINNIYRDNTVSLFKPVKMQPVRPGRSSFSATKNNDYQSLNSYYRSYNSSINDPLYEEQYGLKSINVPQAWEISEGNPELIIAVLDTGANYAHPDLKGKLLPGINVFEPEIEAIDDAGHGTHVSGIIAAQVNNSIGGASVCKNCKVLPIKVLDSDGRGSVVSVAAGIVLAIKNGAKVINMSLGLISNAKNEILNKAIQVALDSGVTVVMAAGNDSVEVGSDLPKDVIIVSSTDQNNERSEFSNYGNVVSVAAPGTAILSTYISDKPECSAENYAVASGTSMSTPHVTGVVALMLSKNPSLTPTQIKNTLEKTAVDLGDSGYDPYFGHGLIDAAAALNNI